MNFIGRLRQVIEQLRGPMQSAPSGRIIVRLADPDLVPCALGGRMHCTHGNGNCCWCRIADRARAIRN